MQTACKKLTNTVAQKKRVITVRDVYTKVIKRVETEVEKVRRALDWVESVKLKKENTRITIHKKWKK